MSPAKSFPVTSARTRARPAAPSRARSTGSRASASTRARNAARTSGRERRLVVRPLGDHGRVDPVRQAGADAADVGRDDGDADRHRLDEHQGQEPLAARGKGHEVERGEDGRARGDGAETVKAACERGHPGDGLATRGLEHGLEGRVGRPVAPAEGQVDVPSRADEVGHHRDELGQSLVGAPAAHVADDHRLARDPERRAEASRRIPVGRRRLEEIRREERSRHGRPLLGDREGGAELGADVVREQPEVDDASSPAFRVGKAPGGAFVDGLDDGRSVREGDPSQPQQGPVRARRGRGHDDVVGPPPEAPGQRSRTLHHGDVAEVAVRGAQLGDQVGRGRGVERPHVDRAVEALAGAHLLHDHALGAAEPEPAVHERDRAGRGVAHTAIPMRNSSQVAASSPISMKKIAT